MDVHSRSLNVNFYSCSQKHTKFYIAVETYGLWGPRGLKFIKEIGKKIKEKTGNEIATSHIIQAIPMTVQRGNATSIMGTLGRLGKL